MAEEKKEQEQKEEAKEKEEKKAEAEKPLDKMTAKELREVALEIDGITGVHAMKKAELLEAIKEAKGIKDEEPAKKKVERGTLTVKELKEKIRTLQEEKKAARTAKDKVKIDVLRRRINRLKKQTRKVARA